MSASRRVLSTFVAASITFGGFMHGAQASLIGTEAVAASQNVQLDARGHERLLETLDRGDVVAALAERGVDVAQARERVAALTDAEAATLADQIDQAPAGGIIGAVLFVFVLLLVTDILGLTKVFPFTRSVR